MATEKDSIAKSFVKSSITFSSGMTISQFVPMLIDPNLVPDYSWITLETDTGEGWFWSGDWQEGERRADADLAAGRCKDFDTIDNLLAYLNAEEEKRGRIKRGK